MEYELPPPAGRLHWPFILHLDDQLRVWCINAIAQSKCPKQAKKPSLEPLAKLSGLGGCGGLGLPVRAQQRRHVADLAFFSDHRRTPPYRGPDTGRD